MEKQHPLTDLMGTAMEKIRTMVDANTIIGTPIQTGDVTLIPVSRLSFGIASGGSDYSIPLLQRAGVDMTTPEPFQITFQKFTDCLNELETLTE